MIWSSVGKYFVMSSNISDWWCGGWWCGLYWACTGHLMRCVACRGVGGGWRVSQGHCTHPVTQSTLALQFWIYLVQGSPGQWIVWGREGYNYSDDGHSLPRPPPEKETASYVV